MRLLITALVLTVLAAPAGAQNAAQSPSATDAKTLYEAHCRKCHGPAGQPSAAMKKLLPELPTWNAAFFVTRSDSAIVSVLRNGKGKNMKPVAHLLNEGQMQALAKYVRTLTP